ncbi:MAG: EAL domain-containing protein [Bacillota bacterium]|nr:EAL domain-containing protein [Bacillota bacterium]
MRNLLNSSNNKSNKENGAEINPLQNSLKIAAIYFILGCLYILSSDRIASWLISDKDMLLLISIIKGWCYVLISAALIFFLIFNTLKRIKNTERELIESYQELSATHEELHYLAYNDSLTGLPNKLSLLEYSNKDFSNKDCAALLFLDMDNFKYINDTMGHAIGDQFIIKVSERLASLLEEDCTLYRLSGDEFIIINQNIKTHEEVKHFASLLLGGFKEEFVVLNNSLHISLSIGIVLYPEHGLTVEELLKYADIAMYRAKEAGKNRYVIYDQLMSQAFTERVDIEKHLHTALSRNEFNIHYQPQLDLVSNKITGMEALLRWNSPELGSISPLKFIKIAEDTHLIIPLGTWVLRNACCFLKKLHNKGYKDLSISINISILQLLQSDFNALVIDTLESFELAPEYLELEITETILIESYEAIDMKLKSLSEYGVRIALDDFGKGYSSLSYLKQLPISILKIDKSFIDNIYNGNENLTRHIITIGKSMGMCVVAEGVEKAEQLDYLVQHECNKIQGYLFSKPLPEEEIIKVLEKR